MKEDPQATTAASGRSGNGPEQSKQSASSLLASLEAWFLEQGGELHKVHVAPISESEGCGLVAREALKPGETVLRVPLACCLHVEAIGKSVLAPLVEAEQELVAGLPDDELLALLLMAERRAGPRSFWWPYLRSMPEEYDTPLYWGEEERRHLQGTNVLLLTNMMEKQLATDWAELHQGLVAAHPEVLGGLSLRDYRWALSTIWSRAVGADRGGRYLRVLAPALDMCNHDPRAAHHLDELLRYDPGTDALALQTNGTEAAVQPGQQCHLFYGPYSNAKLLYSYGFVCPRNPYRGVDYWVRVPPQAKDAHWKEERLRAHPLTAQQAYDFQGTLRGNAVSTALMATVRLIQLAPEEYDRVDRVFAGESVSARNELAAFGSLASLLGRKLAAYGTTVEEDAEALAKLERVLGEFARAAAAEGGEADPAVALRIGGHEQEQEEEEKQQQQKQQQQQQQQGEEDEGEASSIVDAVKTKQELRRAMRRRAMALRVALEDKLVVQDTLACIEHRLAELKAEAEAAEKAAAAGLD